jgi:MoaA/NifB/PqqE/SkfB family radical SAM enzyme
MDASKRGHSHELSFSEKLKVVQELRNVDCRVDLSGGEIMFDRDSHLPLISELSKALGKDRVGISCSGAFINDRVADVLAEYVSDVEMTMDASPNVDFPNRPELYHTTAGKASDLLVSKGVKVGIQTVLTRTHLENPDILSELYIWLREHKVSEWSLRRYFPTGRGSNFPQLELSESENRNLVNYAKILCGISEEPKLDIHYLLPGTEKDTSCRCVKKSIGILPNGDVTACFWGLSNASAINNNHYFLGNIVETPLNVILESKNSDFWRKRCSITCPLSENGGLNVYAA